MHLLQLTSSPEEIDELSSELWEAGTLGVEEIDSADRVLLLAAFHHRNDSLLRRFGAYSPAWREVAEIDWIEETHRAWPARAIGNRLFLAPGWCTHPTPPGRIRIVHNPGQASGTGEHPCTQLALLALENRLGAGATVADIGTGSGILSIAALRLGAARAISADIDGDALHVARESFSLNALEAELVAGSANCLADGIADITVANISGAVLLSIMEDLLRITRAGGCLVLAGFPESELYAFQQLFPSGDIAIQGEWCSIIVKLS